MAIFKYDIINPVTSHKKPFLNSNGIFIIPYTKRDYKYYIECKRYNQNKLEYEYFLLLGNTKFDENCYTCRVDDYCRLQIRVKGEFKSFIEDVSKEKGNVSVTYLESEDTYDVYLIE